MKKIRVMIIDDERSARQELRRLLDNYAGYEIIAEAQHADEAKVLIESRQPDLLFLDIQLPEKSGFELLESLAMVPAVIFVTAFDQYAVKAFEVSALDYLMKPVREERFAKAMAQVAQRLAAGPGARVFIKDRHQYHFVRWNDVCLVSSMDNYVQLHCGDRKLLLKTSLHQLEQRLDPTIFFRANRAQLVNTAFIDKVQTAPDGTAQLLLSTGYNIAVSERQWVKFRQRHYKA